MEYVSFEEEEELRKKECNYINDQIKSCLDFNNDELIENEEFFNNYYTGIESIVYIKEDLIALYRVNKDKNNFYLYDILRGSMTSEQFKYNEEILNVISLKVNLKKFKSFKSDYNIQDLFIESLIKSEELKNNLFLRFNKEEVNKNKGEQ